MNTLENMYEKRLLILAHQAFYYLLTCPMNCLFEKYVTSYDLRGKMTLWSGNRLHKGQHRPQGAFPWLPPKAREKRPRDEVAYKSIIRLNALENQMRKKATQATYIIMIYCFEFFYCCKYVVVLL